MTLTKDAARREVPDPLHKQCYETVRGWILTGQLEPGRSLTLRELSEKLGVSPMPMREAVRRLISDRALRSKDNRRIEIPEMTDSRYEQIIFARLQLEPELAVRALDHVTRAQIEQIAEIDARMDESIERGDSEQYMLLNHRFHFSIYERADCEVLANLVESVWLQFGPFMRIAFERYRNSSLIDHHKEAITALRLHDAGMLREAIAADIEQGMSYIGEVTLLSAELQSSRRNKANLTLAKDSSVKPLAS